MRERKPLALLAIQPSLINPLKASQNPVINKPPPNPHLLLHLPLLITLPPQLTLLKAVLNKILPLPTKIGRTKHGGINEDTNGDELEVDA